jgi:hypothetical protein
MPGTHDTHSNHVNYLEDITHPGNAGSWDYLRYSRFHGDPKVMESWYGCERCERAFYLAATPAYLRSEVEEIAPKHWFDLVYELGRTTRPKFAIAEQGTAVNITNVVMSISGTPMCSLPVVTNRLGTRIGLTVADALGTASLAMKGVIDIKRVLGETGPVVEDCLEMGLTVAWQGKVEDGAKMMAKGMAELFTTFIAAVAMHVFAKGNKTSVNKLTRSRKVNTWIERLPEPVRSYLDTGMRFGLSLRKMGALAARSRASIQVTQGGAGKNILIGELTAGGFRMAAVPEDPAGDEILGGLAGAGEKKSKGDDEGEEKEKKGSELDTESSRAVIRSMRLTEMNRAVFAYSKIPLACDGPFLYGLLGQFRDQPHADTVAFDRGVPPATQAILVGIDGRIYQMTWPDLCDFCFGNSRYGVEFLWARGTYDFRK